MMNFSIPFFENSSSRILIGNLFTVLIDAALFKAFFSFDQSSLILYHQSAFFYTLFGILYIALLSPRLLQAKPLSYGAALLGAIPGVWALAFFFYTQQGIIQLPLGRPIKEIFTPLDIQALLFALISALIFKGKKYSLSLSPSSLQRLLFFTIFQSVSCCLIFYGTPNFLSFMQNAPENLPPLQKSYRSQTGLNFFYADRALADRVEEQLPKIIAILQRSPFFQTAQELSLVQTSKNMLPYFFPNLAHLKEIRINGAFFARYGLSYYFTTEVCERQPLQHNYYSRANPDYTVPIHELTHQMLMNYYGKYYTHFCIPLWKKEGYPEYMSAIGFYTEKRELLDILDFFSIPDDMLSSPIPSSRTPLSPQQVIAAMLQTRYALDYLKKDHQSFFSPFYGPQPADVIYSWLLEEENLACLEPENLRA